MMSIDSYIVRYAIVCIILLRVLAKGLSAATSVASTKLGEV